MDSSLLHLKEDPYCQDRLTILSTQLHQYPVADLNLDIGLFLSKANNQKNVY